MTLLAEDLLLLLLDGDSGKPQTSHLDIALGGAVLAELALGGALTAAERTSFWRSPHLHPVAAARPDDPILAVAWWSVARSSVAGTRCSG